MSRIGYGSGTSGTRSGIRSASRSYHRRTLLRRRSLEETLLNEDERAAFEAIDASITPDEKYPLSFRVYECCSSCFCNKASIALITMVVILIAGILMFEVPRFHQTNQANNHTKDSIDRLRIAGAFLISGGLFGTLGGVTNILALLMLFYELPLIYGTGVMQRQHKQIGNIICRIVVQMLFDSEHLKNYILERINKFTVDVNILECITKGLNSNKAGLIINHHLDDLYSQPEAQYLISMGVSRSLLTPMIRPAILSLCAETAPFVLTHETEEQHSINIPVLREAITGFLLHRVQSLSKTTVSTLMRQLLFPHFLGLVMYGCIVGFFVGILAQALKFSLNPEIGQ